jgi:polyisoprenoid-binding protein YceI
MKKIFFYGTAVLAVALFSFKAIESSTWSVDKGHSKLGFSVTHLMVSDIEGSFKMTSATITSSKEDFSDAVAELTADASSVNTENEQRDTHLKSADFFDAAKYPSITFKSTSFKKISATKYKVKGDLTMHGVTKPVELDALIRMGTNPMMKKTIAGVKLTGTIKRMEFGVGASMPDAMLSNDVNIDANAEFMKN